MSNATPRASRTGRARLWCSRLVFPVTPAQPQRGLRTLRPVNADLQPCPPCKPRLSRVLGSVAAGLVLAAVVLALLPPAQTAKLPSDPVARGEAFEQALAAALTKVRPAGEDWAVAIDPADVNAWLATRLPKWIEHDPSLASFRGATALRIASTDGALRVEDRIAGDWLMLSLPIEVAIETGRLRIGFGMARLGRLPVPGVGTALAESVSAELEGLDLDARAPELPLADGRAVEVREISCEDGRVALRLATRAAARSGG